MNNNILVTGGTGMVGKHLRELGLDAKYVERKECDFTDIKQTSDLFSAVKPNTVIHLAAKVGGIMDNLKNPVGYFEDNILINTNIVKCAHLHGCEKFVGMLSSCIYPDKLRDDEYPLVEDIIHNGPPTPSNFSYGYAKRCLQVQIDTYRQQYNRNFYGCIVPCNLYSEYDHFEGDKAHFVTSLIRKITHAKLQNKESIDLFGSGKPLRQFMHAEDLASAIILYINSNCNEPLLNVATPETFSIKEIAEIGLKACDAEHIKINWDSSKPDGQFRKDVSDKKFKQFFPNFRYISLQKGIQRVYNRYNEMVTVRI